jgi:small subunit ribosomal protein S6
MALYEHIFLARQDLSGAQVDEIVQNYKTLLEENGGSVGRIEKNRKAHYAIMNIDAPHAAVHEMERQMRINEDILRYITVSVDEHEETPSVMMQKRDRDDRGRGGRDDRPRGDRDDRPRRPRENQE